MDSDKQYKMMTETPVSKLVLKLALPTIFSMLITSIYNLADTYFVGQISTSASGAVGIVSSLMAIIQAFGFMYGHGAGSNISRHLGNKDIKEAKKFASTSMLLAVITGSIICVFGLCFLEPFMLLLGSSKTILPHAKAYAFYILLASPFMMASVVMNNILRYEGKAFYAMIGLVTGGLINIFLDAVFVLKFEMGTGGAGLATAISQLISFFLLSLAFLMHKTASSFSLKAVSKAPKDYLLIFSNGLPSFGRQGLSSIATMLLNVYARTWGDPAVAAMSIVSRIFLFLLSASLGIGQGFQPVAAFNYGAKKYKRVKDSCLFTMVVGFACAIVVSTLCYIFAEPLIKIFRDDPAVTEIALPAFRYQTIAMLFQPIIVCASMLFQSIGKSVRATFLALCRQGLYFLPLIFILPAKLGVFGLEICQPMADALTVITATPLLISFLIKLSKMKE